MTTLKESLDHKKLGNLLWGLTNDLDSVFGIKVTSTDAAEIWISSPGTEETVRERCKAYSLNAEENDKPDALRDLQLVFHNELQDADIQGGAAKRPRPQENHVDGHPEHPGGGSNPVPFATTSEVD